MKGTRKIFTATRVACQQKVAITLINVAHICINQAQIITGRSSRRKATKTYPHAVNVTNWTHGRIHIYYRQHVRANLLESKTRYWFMFYRNLFLGSNWQMDNIDSDKDMVPNRPKPIIWSNVALPNSSTRRPRLYKLIYQYDIFNCVPVYYNPILKRPTVNHNAVKLWCVNVRINIIKIIRLWPEIDLMLVASFAGKQSTWLVVV